MTIPNWHEEAISKKHDRNTFNCGDAVLNQFLYRHARQNHENGSAKTYLAINTNNNIIIGYYSLCPASIEFERTPEVIARGLARHDIPVFRLARLATDLSVQGKGLGGQLLLAAGKRCLAVASELGGVALLIDAKNERVANWYISYGAVPLLDSPLSLLISFKTIYTALRMANKI
ncbi:MULTISPECIES: GNAT family N-acetyltransferase [Proteus]|uniref:GNAT family N-acetyltransferase n=1 Tax=Proteus appendicitidis TaxID=3034648 RepID=A0ABY8Y3X5_9GAMM|nr:MULTISPECIES: GNAT family N-acetyltransferase [unclassified Proteus (in: enterobacteria)]QEZ92378.1 GNAT family N-acetyltransferase [Proteus sp. CD3]WIV86861.1 GNAT family N-acetyltransferase [Proteus sp. HZ0627]